ncbi:unnamed protein product [Bemisia tabaci]|uniref:Sidoreflexin n=1 Tax=Bemisia tabaci TaxID=7038 RepID=A0A9P0F1L9_BEMTA|nr:unnamed protein product [Bemisia tabaci]
MMSKQSATGSSDRIDIEASPWDLDTYVGRVKYFAWVTDPRLCFLPDKQYEEAKVLRNLYKEGKEPAGTTKEEVMNAKRLYESAFHPDTGDKQNVFGRMSFQMPGGMLVTGAMLAFYKSTPQVVFWQWVNQSFNAYVNYTNRNAKSPLSTTQLATAYSSATLSACLTAINLKKFLAKKSSNPILQRFVPFFAVAAANAVNIPLMRQNEIITGVDVSDKNSNVVGSSRIAAVKGISLVVLSRIIMCSPGMLILPIFTERLEKNPWLKAQKWFSPVFQTLGCGVCLIFMVPLACALFPQNCSISINTLKTLDSAAYEEIKKNTKGELPSKVYFNKGL